MSLREKMREMFAFTGKVKKAAMVTYAASLISIFAGIGVNTAAIVNQEKATDLANEIGFEQYYKTYQQKDWFSGITKRDAKRQAESEFVEIYGDKDTQQKYKDFCEKRDGLLQTSYALIIPAATASALMTGAAVAIEKNKQRER